MPVEADCGIVGLEVETISRGAGSEREDLSFFLSRTDLPGEKCSDSWKKADSFSRPPAAHRSMLKEGLRIFAVVPGAGRAEERKRPASWKICFSPAHSRKPGL